MRSLKLAGSALLAAAIVGSIEAVVTNPAMAGPALLAWPLVVPSVLLFVVIERYVMRRKWAAHLVYLLSVLPVNVGCIVMLIRPNFDGVTHEIALAILGSYLPEALGAYLVLLLGAKEKPYDSA